jgi:ABC-type oligopeptide transport system substrate-binding subunit
VAHTTLTSQWLDGVVGYPPDGYADSRVFWEAARQRFTRSIFRRKKRMRLGTRKLGIAGLVVIIGTLAMLLSACGSTSSSTGNKAPPDKQIFNPLDSGPNNGDADTLDPAQVQFGWDYDKSQLLFPSLIALSDDLKPYDFAAQSHEVSSDGLTWTFHVRSGMKWSDGSTIDANTFAYSINRALDPCLASPVASYLYNIKGASDFNNATCPAGATASTDTLIGKSIVVSDPLTLKLTLDAPAAYFLGTFSYPTSWAVPKQLVDKYGAKWTDHLVDNGGFGGSLYKLTVFDHAGHMAMVANPNFWGTKPVVQKINWTLYKDINTLWADYKSGQGDLGYFPAAELATAKALHGSTEYETPGLTVHYVFLNWSKPPFDDVRVRNAFSLAMDRKALAHNVAKDLAVANIHMIIKGLPGYNENLKNAAGDSGDAALVANVAKAQELAKSYATDKCSGDFAKCPPVVYTYANGSSTQLLRAQVLQQQWQTAFPGWNITLQGLDRSVELKTEKTLQMGYEGWGADYPDPQDFMTLLWAKDAQYNRTFNDIPEADALMKQADVNNDQTARLTQYQQAEQLMLNQGSFAAYDQPLSTYVLRNTISGWHYANTITVALGTWQTFYVKA